MLSLFRQKLTDLKLAAFLIPTADPHQSEYLAECDKRREFISKFTGSAGVALITQKEALLWTDGRYFLQAQKELPEQWKLMKQGIDMTKEEWIKKNLKGNLGIDPWLTTVTEYEKMKADCGKEVEIFCVDENLIDLIWKERPKRPDDPVQLLSLEFTGKSTQEKLKELREQFDKQEEKVEGIFLEALDEIAWLLNLRGSDISYNPVFFSFMLILRNETRLFIEKKKIPEKVMKYLNEIPVKIFPIESLEQNLKDLKLDGKLILSQQSSSVAVQKAVTVKKSLLLPSFVSKMKAIKNPVEQDGFRQCHLQDGAALCDYFGWLENELVNKKSTLNEVQAADYCEKMRSKRNHFVGLSFDTISSIGPNGAIIHYKPHAESCATLNTNEIYLCDSGGQYLNGTTDVTRTFHFGQPKPLEKKAFTRVLQGHIALANAVFPPKTTGYLLDPFARQFLWQEGWNYAHGTGHGVGHYLNVHEGPHGIGVRKNYDSVPLEPGMTVTNEPGYYLENHFGIRIENILLVKQSNVPSEGPEKFLCFENVTWVPLGKNLMDKQLLSPKEVEWINHYHQQCFEKLSPLLEKDSLGYLWLKKETTPL